MTDFQPRNLREKILSEQALTKDKLEVGKYYKGSCRNASIARWNGTEFIYIRKKFGSTFPETIKHFEDDDGFDVYFPFEEVASTETIPMEVNWNE